MTLNDYKNLILDTEENDWTKIGCFGAGAGPSYKNSMSVWTKGDGEFHNIDVESHYEVMSLKKDLLVSVAYGITHNDDFVEGWANAFADSHASSSFIDFFYSNQMVYRDIYVSVDGGRANLPLPSMKLDDSYNVVGLEIARDKYEFFKNINRDISEYDRYISMAKISIVDKDWMV